MLADGKKLSLTNEWKRRNDQVMQILLIVWIPSCNNATMKPE